MHMLPLTVYLKKFFLILLSFNILVDAILMGNYKEENKTWNHIIASEYKLDKISDIQFFKKV